METTENKTAAGCMNARGVMQASYLFIFVSLLIIGYEGLATPFLTVLFSLLALHTFSVSRKRWVAVTIFLLAVAAIFWTFIWLLHRAYIELPDIISTTIPELVKYAERLGIDLPFSDGEGLKALVSHQLAYLANFAKIATKEFVVLLIGLVIAVSIYYNRQIDLDHGRHPLKNNLYTLLTDQIAARFVTFYHSFATVMGAQLIISTINTGLTAIFLLLIGLPYTPLVVAFTFLCGLLPIIGNVVSNTVIVGIALALSPRLAVAALIFLVVLHKLEYFLNSKIIGGKIRNPMWLTLMGLIVGEELMGVPGMILAPVVLHYLKVEGAQSAVELKSGEWQSPVSFP